MIFGALADLVLVAHAAFVVFAVLGGLLVMRWPRVAWVHLPAVIWAVVVEYAGWICPLTPIENALREAAGRPGYAGAFLDHYLVPVLYPASLTRELQVVLGSALLILNGVAYWQLVRRRLRPHRP